MKENCFLWYRVNLRVFHWPVLNHIQNLFLIQFLIVSVCLASLQKFLSTELICIVRPARAFSSPSRYFQLPTNFDKDFFRCLLCCDAATIFTKARRLLTSTNSKRKNYPLNTSMSPSKESPAYTDFLFRNRLTAWHLSMRNLTGCLYVICWEMLQKDDVSAWYVKLARMNLQSRVPSPMIFLQPTQLRFLGDFFCFCPALSFCIYCKAEETQWKVEG